MTTTRRFFSGDSLEQAIMQAARHHHLLPDQVAYKTIEKRHGFLKIRRGVVISVDPAAPQKSEEAATLPPELETPTPAPSAERPAPPEREADRKSDREPTRERSPKRRPKRTRSRSQAKEERDDRQVAPWHLADSDSNEPETEAEPVVEASVVVTDEATRVEPGSLDDAGSGDHEPQEEVADEAEEKFELVDDMADGAREAVEQLLEFLDIDDMSIEVREGEDRLEVELSGDSEDRLLEDRGALLLAVEHLVPRLLRGILGRSAPCRVDCGGFHEEREQRLEDIATDAADEARRRQRPRTLAPMSPEERRIVHLTLADDPDVRTESQGRGFFKRVTVSPVRHRSRVYD